MSKNKSHKAERLAKSGGKGLFASGSMFSSDAVDFVQKQNPFFYEQPRLKSPLSPETLKAFINKITPEAVWDEKSGKYVINDSKPNVRSPNSTIVRLKLRRI